MKLLIHIILPLFIFNINNSISQEQDSICPPNMVIGSTFCVYKEVCLDGIPWEGFPCSDHNGLQSSDSSKPASNNPHSKINQFSERKITWAKSLDDQAKHRIVILIGSDLLATFSLYIDTYTEKFNKQIDIQTLKIILISENKSLQSFSISKPTWSDTLSGRSPLRKWENILEKNFSCSTQNLENIPNSADLVIFSDCI